MSVAFPLSEVVFAATANLTVGHKGRVTVKEVHTFLRSKLPNKKWHHQTIGTIMARLVDAGWLCKDGYKYYVSPDKLVDFWNNRLFWLKWLEE